MTLAALGVGPIFYSQTTAGGANPQLLYFENIPGHDATVRVAYSNATLSVHAVNIPLSLSYNYPMVWMSWSGTGTQSVSHGLYSLNGATLSLANSASGSWSHNATGRSWISMVTSATQNITPGTWYFAINFRSSNGSSFSFQAFSSINPGNANPYFYKGRMTVSTTAMPASIATSNLDITGSDVFRQPYVLITA